MSTKKSIKVGLLLLIVSMYVVSNSFGQIPFVYSVENTAVDCTMPPLPSVEELPTVQPLTDPFEWSDGSGRDTTFVSWTRRRGEIKAEIEHYEIGPKPERPDTINATLISDTLLIVEIIENGDTLYLTSNITLPEGPGPFPAVIGMGGGSGSISTEIFTSRDIAVIPFYYTQVMAHTQTRGLEPINDLYPDLIYMGAYSAWPWGVSRLIDGLELVADSLPIDFEHIAVSGCSFAGKMALFVGAFDERIALTISQEPGGGGAAAWRVSETLDGVENLGNTSHAWFMESMFDDFSGNNVSKLPHDHHELITMIAPRAALILGNPPIQWLADESGYVSCVAAKKVWENFGIEDRFGYSFVGGHEHCWASSEQTTAVEAFVDKFLLGDTTTNTDVTDHPYPDVVPEYWTDWWGKGEPKFANLDRGTSDEVWLEAECAETKGAGWNVMLDAQASNGSYIMPKPGLDGSVKPTNPEAYISFPFTVNHDTTYFLYGRLNCPSYNNDSYWLKLDDEDFKIVSSFLTNGWDWKTMAEFELTAGEHTFTFAFREPGALLDKLCISEFRYPPGEMGETAENVCTPDTTTQDYISALEEVNVSGAYVLEQNFPNPLNNMTTIAFEIPCNTFVSLKVYSIMGEEVAELAGKEYTAGKHTVEFNALDVAEGIYFYTIKADEYTASRKMIIQNE